MNYYERHLGDYAKNTGHLSMLEHGAYTLLLDRYYSTEAGIPADQAHRIARARTKEEKDAVDSVLNEFFFIEDGIWKNKRAEEVIQKYIESIPNAQAKKENQRERQKRARERREQLFERARSLGITLPYNATTTHIETLLSRHAKEVNHSDVTHHVTRDDTATQSPDTNNQTPVINPPYPPCGDNRAKPSDLSIAFRSFGIQAQPADPKIIALAEQGVSVETVRAACQTAKNAKPPNERIPVGYVIGILERWAKDAAGIDVAGAKPREGKDDERKRVLDELTGKNRKRFDESRTIDGETGFL